VCTARLDYEHITSYIPATMFGKTAKLFLKYVDKGDVVHMAGRLDSNEWKTDDGKNACRSPSLSSS
jgi:single-stranded DNA-binding protein